MEIKAQKAETEKEYHLKEDKKAFLFPHEFERMLDLTNPKQKYSLRFLTETGARINEARNVDNKDIDHERKNITLRVTKVRAKLKETRPTPRTIPISSSFYKFLKKNINSYQVLSTNATRIMLQKLAKEVGTKSNWEDFSAHNLRKTFGTWMLALGVNGFKLAQHLGHSPDMLRTAYASPDVFNYKDKEIMREILDDLPSRMRGDSSDV